MPSTPSPLRRGALGATAAAIAATAMLASAPPTFAATAAKPYDFNGDGRQEAVVGLPRWVGPGGAEGVGAVAVAAGTRSGLGAVTVVRQGIGGTPDTGERFDAFGAGVASADFDRDGFADLAIGAPGEDVGGAQDVEGSVTVLYGSPAGLGGPRSQTLAGPGNGQPFSSSGFGTALAAGDLNRDGFADLVVGTTNEDELPESDFGSGAIRIVFGSATGLVTSAPQRKLARPRPADAVFGTELALGDIDRDGNVDIVEGAQGQTQNIDFGGVPGHVSFCRGAAAGPVACRSVGGSMRGGPTSLAIGDVNGDRRPDLVEGIGVNAFIDEDDPLPPGAVVIRLGTASGPSASPLTIGQRSPGVPGASEAGDAFGTAVTVGDLDHDGFADIVVGAPGEDARRGRVTVLRGGPRAYATSGAGALLVGQETAGIPGTAGSGDQFGADLTLLDHDGDGRADLTIGVPGEHGSGALATLPGARRGPLTTGVRSVSAPGSLRSGQTGLRFGERLAHVAGS